MYSGADCVWHGEGHLPPLLQMAGHRGTENRRTANKKLTKLLAIPKVPTKTTNCTCRTKKVEGQDQRKFSDALHQTCAPPSNFHICSGATAYKLVVYFESQKLLVNESVRDFVRYKWLFFYASKQCETRGLFMSLVIQY